MLKRSLFSTCGILQIAFIVAIVVAFIVVVNEIEDVLLEDGDVGIATIRKNDLQKWFDSVSSDPFETGISYSDKFN